jgi:hypothetical protein
VSLPLLSLSPFPFPSLRASLLSPSRARVSWRRGFPGPGGAAPRPCGAASPAPDGAAPRPCGAAPWPPRQPFRLLARGLPVPGARSPRRLRAVVPAPVRVPPDAWPLAPGSAAPRESPSAWRSNFSLISFKFSLINVIRRATIYFKFRFINVLCHALRRATN